MSMRMELTLISDRDIPLWGRGGKAIHGLFLDLVKRRDKKVSDDLHAPEEIKPFTCGFSGPVRKKGARRVIPSGSAFTIVFTVLDPELEHLVFTAVWDVYGKSDTCHLAGIPVRIISRGDESLMVERMDASGLMQTSSDNNSVTLRFDTPTGFRRLKTQVLFPEPELVFGSLMRKWTWFHPKDNLQISPSVFSDIRIKEYRLRTRMLEFGEFRQIGFTGYTVFDLKKIPDPARHAVHVLSAYARFAGVGAKTTMGMGGCRKV